jgi:hypothetical protein
MKQATRRLGDYGFELIKALAECKSTNAIVDLVASLPSLKERMV